MNKEIAVKAKIKKARAWELDLLRGVAIILVLFDHTMLTFWHFLYNWRQIGIEWLIKLGESGRDYWTSDLRLFWRPVFIFIFFFVSGLCTAFSRNNFKRGLKLAMVAGIVTLVTYIAEQYFMLDNVLILFGILHSMATIILIYALITFISNLVSKKNKYVLAVSCILIGIVAIFLGIKYNLTLKQVTLGPEYYIETPKQWLGLFIFVESWWSADYFPILPFVGYFLLGAGLSVFVYPNKTSLLPKLDGFWHKPITIIGRHSLIVYLFITAFAFILCHILTYIATGVFAIYTDLIIVY